MAEYWGMRMIWAGAAALAGLMVATGNGMAGSDPSGIWRMASGKVTVKLAPCGNAFCGTVVGLKRPLDKHGRPKRDKENPNPSLRERPVIGLMIMANMVPTGDNRWDGTIYNPDDGKSYRSNLKLQNTNLMKVEGCVSVFCKTMKFIRVK